ncbi:MAG: DNA mismatch repair protein MutS [Planctomycetota bacterium]|jgi:DNA mismatch repair protein MutS
MIRSTAGTEQTPMMRQYTRAKEQHPNEILFFRMGDFYEMFFEDARACAELLGITLTARSKERNGQPIPMAGIPVKSVDTYIRRLVKAGRRVAICEQVQDAKEAKGIVEREVVRVVTPGTFVDEDTLDEHQPLHLASIVVESDGVGIAWVDLSTGRFHAEDLPLHSRWPELLLAIAPRECLHAEGRPAEDGPLAWLASHHPECSRTPYPEWHYDHETGRERLLAHFGTRTLEGFGCEHLGPGLSAAGALIHYLGETQRQALPHIARLRTGGGQARLGLDAATHRALDLLSVSRTGERRGSLLGHLDRTRTAMGARLLREWVTAPLAARDAILVRQSAVAALVDDPDTRQGVREALAPVRDIERLTSRLTMGRANGRDLRALEASLRATPLLRRLLESVESGLVREVLEDLEDAPLLDMAERIDRAIVDEPPLALKDGGVIRAGFDPDLDELRAVSQEGVDWIARFQAEEIERTGIPTLKVGFNRVFGYYIEVTHTHRDRIPEDYRRKQTLKNAERYVTPSLKEQEDRVLGAKERAESLEVELFQSFRDSLVRELPVLQRAAASLATIDALQSLATVAFDEDYVRPEIVEEPLLEIEEGRHPVLAAGHGRSDFTPNDTLLGGEHGALAVITGPNMAGKSTYIRQTALIVLLAQLGSFVPAARARVGIADRIFTRVGAADDITRGQSTFMVEMTETANILNNATERSVVILDEVGRGTSTLDGVSLAWAISEHLVEPVGARTLFATHYHELTELSERHPGQVENLNVAVREWKDEIVFLHKIVPGGTDKAYGIHVARLAGIPPAVLDRARTILGHLEQEHIGGRGTPASIPTPTEPPPPPGSAQQLGLFAARGDDVIRELEALDPNSLTPLDALSAIFRWREKL